MVSEGDSVSSGPCLKGRHRRMELIKPPDQLLLSGCIAKNWDLFKQKFELFLQATADPKEPRSEATKTALLLSVAGNDALEVFNNFTFVEGESKEDYATVVQKFEAYCKEQLNEVYERYMFRSRTQAETEPFEHFLRDLRKLARSCNFADLADSMIRDQVVFGTNNVKLREKMLKVKDLTLLKAEQICKASEASAQQNETWGQSERVVAAVKRRQQFRCSNCNRSHERGRCPAFGKACFLCGGQNHFAACCKSGPRVGEVVEQRDTFDILDVRVCTVGSNADWIVNAQVADQNTVFKVDTGSQANLLPYSVYRRCRNVTGLQPSGSILRSYSGDVIKHIGVATLPVVANKSASFTFFILKKGRQPILGLQASEALGLVCRPVDAVTASSSEGILQEFSHLFQGTGRVAREYRMVMREDAVPVVLPARRVPVALQEPFRQELERLERGGIIEKVDEPTDWFVPGKELLLADMLSRSPPRNAGDTSGSTEDVEIHAIATVSDMVSKKTFSRLVDATANDADLQKAMAYLRGNGDLGGSLKPFAAELSTIQGILLKGTKVVVPKSMRAEMLQRIHEGHLGMNKCKAKARLLVFWPGLNGDIETMLKECAVCRKYAYKQQSEPYILRPIPNYAWSGRDMVSEAG
ncbi:uncharacterized protein LOC144136799 [Haemaphysalis longicornis]